MAYRIQIDDVAVSVMYGQIYTHWTDVSNWERLLLLPGRQIRYEAAGTGTKRKLNSWRTWRYHIWPVLVAHSDRKALNRALFRWLCGK